MTSLSLEQTLREVEQAAARVATADSSTLASLRTELLGRKAGKLTHVLRSLASLSPDQRRDLGARANHLKQQLEQAIADREAQLARGAAAGPRVDGTMPGRPVWRGALHPVTTVVDEICDIFRELGFTRVVGPEIETEAYNFTKLNISLDHPAADAQDTFYLAPGTLLRTHTSPMQAHIMERYAPPIRIVVPGQVYRRDTFDPSHSPVFEQIEGLVVDQGVSFVDFKAGIDFFLKRFFARDTVVRFRPSFYPFTEPSADVDVQCQICKGSGCPTCKRTGFLEIMGAGMVHPAVFEACGLDAERYTGYAFGMGPQRIAMLRHAIPDIRLLWSGDMRFLDQFVE
ncbi:MAG: phenylalanine--tRNA ligase subunit alpha [Gemmatimonadetes bacterium RIFCSPLOWO2_12_FULL_68_9]|nr:MAG: phenylalanine--tRNA ligase subunit alpha [Gemmatimonadetes bacterium RIFCSPLOWO2_12_FULL_68_9]